MKKEIWAVGGGKGGTGKSVISTLFALSIAKKGKKVILIDGDMGGANLHTFFGISPEKSSLNDFFEKKIPLNETLIDTDISNIQLITGDMRSYNPVSIRYIQRLKFYRHIKELSADIIIIDLGAGTNLNTIDSFLLAEKMIILSTPEITSIENLYVFVKKIIARKIKDLLYYKGFKEITENSLKSNIEDGEIITFTDFIDQLRNIGDEQKKIVNDGLAALRINIVMNQIRNNKFLKYGVSLKNVLKRHFGINALYSGYIKYSEIIEDVVNRDHPSKIIYENSEFMTEFWAVTKNIIEGNDIPFNDLEK